MKTFQGIRRGDRVTFTDRFGHYRTGRAQALLLFPDHVVLNMGGRHGTPQVVDASNYVSHTTTHQE